MSFQIKFSGINTSDYYMSMKQAKEKGGTTGTALS